MQLFNFFFHCNYYISCCAVLLSLQVFSLTGSIDYFVLAEIFFCTNSIYLLHSIFGIDKIPDSLSNHRISFLKKQSKSLRVLFVISFVSAVIFFFFLNFKNQLLLLIVFFPALGYIYPVYRDKRLRDLPFLKVILTASMWTVLTVLLPFFVTTYSTFNIYNVLIERFLFLFSIALLFDIRDVEIEERVGVLTFPIAFGKLFVVLFSIFLMSIWLLVNLFTYHLYASAFMLPVYLIFIILSLKCLKPQSDVFYVLILDGLMILQPMLFLLANYINK